MAWTSKQAVVVERRWWNGRPEGQWRTTIVIHSSSYSNMREANNYIFENCRRSSAHLMDPEDAESGIPEHANQDM